MTRQIFIFDTTLRDGAQTQGIDFSISDKHAIAHALDLIGIDYIEGGWPGANPIDNEFFSKPLDTKKSRFVAFGMTRKNGVSASNDTTSKNKSSRVLGSTGGSNAINNPLRSLQEGRRKK